MLDRILSALENANYVLDRNPRAFNKFYESVGTSDKNKSSMILSDVYTRTSEVAANPYNLASSSKTANAGDSYNIAYSKGGKQNIKDTGLSHLSDEEITRLSKDRTLSGQERMRYKKEDKARGQRGNGMDKDKIKNKPAKDLKDD